MGPTQLCTLRAAETDDIPALEALIKRSALALSEPFYSREQTEALTRLVFGVDSQLITDKTYLLIESNNEFVACGGWSKRRTFFGGDKFGGDKLKNRIDPLLDPATEPARIRAFFVSPDMARRGLATQLMAECIRQAKAASFSALELASTLPGEPLYLARGFEVIEHFELTLANDIQAPLTRMRRAI